MDPMSPPSVSGANQFQARRIMSPPTRHRPSPTVSNKDHSPWSRVVMDAPALPFLGASSQYSQPSPYMSSSPTQNRIPNPNFNRDAFSPPLQPPQFPPDLPELRYQPSPLSPLQPHHNKPGSPKPRNHLPWAHVVLQANSPPTLAAVASPHLSYDHLRPQHQDSPRASLEDLISTEPLDGDCIETGDKDEDDEDYPETLSVSSSIYRGHMEHGRRYAQDSNYIVPSDDKQFESMAAGHIMYAILESQRENPFFRSPIPSEGHHHVLDIGTGDGTWAIDVADRFQNFTVHGVDLYPPPQNWIPPNCIFEVDDLSKPWLWEHKFSFIHMRLLLGAFSSVGWDRLYKEAYDHLEPGGWIEHVECDIDIKCQDDSLPGNSQLTTFGRVANDCANELGHPLTIYHEMKARIERAGFVNIQEKLYKIPIGGWPRHPTYKDAGKCSLKQFQNGLSGWMLRLLTKYGNPEPWEPRKAMIYLAVLKSELEAGHHIYQDNRRIWAQKPY